jgi:hypothetical protein
VALLLLTAGALIATLSLTRGPTLFAKLPDAQLLLLNRLGVDEALTELAARTTRTPPLSDAHWRSLITRGLAHQADTDAPWDPRWGQILGQSFIQRRMTEDQIRAYLRLGLDAEVFIRDRIAHDADRVGYWINWKQGRITTSGPAVMTGMRYAQRLTRAGVVGDNQPERQGHDSSGELIIAGPGGGGSSGTGSVIMLPPDPRADEVRVFIETRLVLMDADAEPVITLEPERVERRVRRLPPDEAVVGLVTDPTAAETVRTDVTVTPLTIAIPDPEQVPRWGVTVSQMHIMFGDRPRAVAGRLSALLEDGEVELGVVRLPAGSGQHGYGVGDFVTPAELTAKLARLRDLARRGTIDVVFRTDPGVANDDPRIDEVLDLTLVFKNVPINVVADLADVQSVQSRATRVPASPAGNGP